MFFCVDCDKQIFDLNKLVFVYNDFCFHGNIFRVGVSFYMRKISLIGIPSFSKTKKSPSYWKKGPESQHILRPNADENNSTTLRTLAMNGYKTSWAPFNLN